MDPVPYSQLKERRSLIKRYVRSKGMGPILLLLLLVCLLVLNYRLHTAERGRHLRSCVIALSIEGATNPEAAIGDVRAKSVARGVK
jgi:hypothetical protein